MEANHPHSPQVCGEGVVCRVLEVWSQPVAIGTSVASVRQGTARLKTEFDPPHSRF